MLGKIFYNVAVLGSVISICILPLLVFLNKNKYKYSLKSVYRIFLFIFVLLILPINMIDFSEVKYFFHKDFIEKIEIYENTPEIKFERENTIIEVNDSVNIKNDKIFNVTKIVPYIWCIIGMLLLISNLCNYIIFLHNLKKSYIKKDNNKINVIIEKLCNEMNIKKISYEISEIVTTPITVGFFKKKIIFSKEILNNREYELILKHELFHIKNKDIEYKFLLLILNCVYWFNPIIYMFINQIDEILELNCDEFVIQGKKKSCRIEYAEILLDQIQKNQNIQYKFSINFANRRKNIMNRFSNIVDETKKKSIVNVATMSGLLIVIAVFIITIIPNINFATQDDETLNQLDVYEEEQVKEIENIETTDRTEEFINPLKDRYTLTSRFGQRMHNFHKGVDLATGSGNDIVAVKSGEVIFSGYEGAYGNLVIIQHEGSIKTCYGQCSNLNVNVGDKVNQGDVIANVGSTGNSTGPHLHFEIRINDEVVNPQDYIDF